MMVLEELKMRIGKGRSVRSCVGKLDSRLALAAAVAATLMAAQSASAQSIADNFTGAANDGGLWATPANWDQNRTPTLEDDVTFGTTATSVVLPVGTSTMGI